MATIKTPPKRSRIEPKPTGPARSTLADPCTQYALDVRSGRIVAGDLVIRACRRHLDDRDNGQARGIKFDEETAQTAYGVFSLLTLSKGKFGGHPFKLEPWQHFVVGSVFGWRRIGTNERRFTSAHVEVARKNGKTHLAAGVALKMLGFDNEHGAEVFAVATKRDQAKLTHKPAASMIGKSPTLRNYFKRHVNNITHEPSESKFEPLGADADTLDGLDISCAICDELHAWKSRDLWDVIETATGAREQPLIFSITTAGTGREGIWWERRDLAVKVLTGVIPDDSLFAAIYTLDKSDNHEDDWTDERNWIKANPNLGVSVRLEELRQRVREAITTPGKQNATKRLRLNIPTNQVEIWIPPDKWEACPESDAGPAAAPGHDTLPPGAWWRKLEGRICYTGVDLSATIDMSATAHLFPPIEEREPWYVLMRFWLPESNIEERERRDRAAYRLWASQGFLELIPGEVIEHDVIDQRLREDAKRFRTQAWSFDRALAAPITTKLLADGFNVKGFGQGFLSMASAVREFEKLLYSARFAHGGNPVLRFNAACAACKQDPAGNRKPDKQRSTGRIDGLFAILNALGLAIATPPPIAPTITIL